MTFDVFDKLLKCFVEPVMNYGSSIWGISKQPKLEAVKNKAARFFLGVRRNTANLAVLGDMGWTQNHMIQKTAVIRYWNRLCNTDNDRMLYKVHSWSMRNGRSWEGRVRKKLDMNVNPNNGQKYIYSRRQRQMEGWLAQPGHSQQITILPFIQNRTENRKLR